MSPAPFFSKYKVAMLFEMKQTRFASQEIQLVNTNGKYTFPNDNFLNGKTVVGMWIQDNSSDDGKAPSGADLVPNPCIRASILTVRRDADAKILDFPLSYFLESTGDRSPRRVHIDGFNPGTSFVTILDTTTFAVNESIVIGVEYIDPHE